MGGGFEGVTRATTRRFTSHVLLKKHFTHCVYPAPCGPAGWDPEEMIMSRDRGLGTVLYTHPVSFESAGRLRSTLRRYLFACRTASRLAATASQPRQLEAWIVVR